jgi:hypothetical protein
MWPPSCVSQQGIEYQRAAAGQPTTGQQKRGTSFGGLFCRENRSAGALGRAAGRLDRLRDAFGLLAALARRGCGLPRGCFQLSHFLFGFSVSHSPITCKTASLWAWATILNSNIPAATV